MTYVHDTLEQGPAIDIDHAPPLAAPIEPPTRWNIATRVAFRFFAAYFTGYILFTQMFNSLMPWSWAPNPESVRVFQIPAAWVGANLLGLQNASPIVSGSGDKEFDYAFAFTLMLAAALVTLLWSALDRRRLAYPSGHKWFRLFLRWGLGATMLTYGMIKMIPSQMPYPGLTRLLEPYGHFSLMGVLWAQIGASPAYQTITGIVETMCAVLLFVPGLTAVGALLSVMTATHIFILNMTYDVPVKLFSFHLVLMSLMLLAPDARRLFRVVVMRRAAEAAPEPALVQRQWLGRAIVAAQIAYAVMLFTAGYQNVMTGVRTYGSAAPKPAWYGIWEIEKMTIDGAERAPLVTDAERWRRLVIQNTRSLSFQKMDDTFMGFSARFEEADGRIVLTDGNPQGPKELGRLAVRRDGDDRLVVEGRVREREYRLETRRMDHTQMRLNQSQFRWMQQFPFNR